GPATSLTSIDAGGLQNDTTNVLTIDITGAGKVKLGGSGILNTSRGLIVDTIGAAKGTFDLASFSQTVNTLNDGTGTSGTVTSTAAGSTFTVNNGGSFGGVISGTTNLALTLAAGTQTLTGANTYTGATTINAAGTLQLGNGSTTGSLAAGTAIS